MCLGEVSSLELGPLSYNYYWRVLVHWFRRLYLQILYLVTPNSVLLRTIFSTIELGYKTVGAASHLITILRQCFVSKIKLKLILNAVT